MAFTQEVDEIVSAHATLILLNEITEFLNGMRRIKTAGTSSEYFLTHIKKLTQFNPEEAFSSDPHATCLDLRLSHPINRDDYTEETKQMNLLIKLSAFTLTMLLEIKIKRSIVATYGIINNIETMQEAQKRLFDESGALRLDKEETESLFRAIKARTELKTAQDIKADLEIIGLMLDDSPKTMN